MWQNWADLKTTIYFILPQNYTFDASSKVQKSDSYFFVQISKQEEEPRATYHKASAVKLVVVVVFRGIEPVPPHRRPHGWVYHSPMALRGTNNAQQTNQSNEQFHINFFPKKFFLEWLCFNFWISCATNKAQCSSYLKKKKQSYIFFVRRVFYKR